MYSPSAYGPPSSFSSGSAFASSTSSFRAAGSPSSFGFYSGQRSTSPTRVHLAGISSSSSAPSTSFRLSIVDRPTSPGRSLSVSTRDHQIVKRPIAPPASTRRRTCMCSPTTHPGSFRCALHKNTGPHHGNGGNITAPSSRLNMRRSAMTNSLVRIGTVEGSDLIKRALSSLIRPSSHQQRRRFDFQPRPSRLSIMYKAVD
ncbi:unnamed protein product [Spirodela intermedia]|uniref:Uncharacterized protein n=2 Tax=Spirodela intermedia TaxID=51605 RepID=A0A7I8JJQ8_SPIIN|nr:unnamed protein product [Spirodela intermedia]CAA6670417.1 unnamed protein product [Spirodela intermedia]CAA7407483.1 unnamed protein product [Spirodela intermedia]